ncbi:SH3 domain-containing protein, partial [Anaerolineae bacterium CFX9]|nr:SH3 domain-containing protein [Anaerolineae bacterium CFX9]
MNRTRLIRRTALLCAGFGAALLLLGGWLLPRLEAAPMLQANVSCPPVVIQALESVGEACNSLDRNSACYGYNRVNASFAEPDVSFSAVGDIASLLSLQTIETSPLDIEQNIWGVALMNVQANLPNSLPGQSVIFMLLGDAQIENAVAPENAFQGGIPINLRATAETSLYQQPRADSALVRAVPTETTLTADARSTDGVWFRVAVDGQYGWASRDTLQIPAPAERLPAYDVSASRTPMQAFYLRTGAGSPVCGDAPDALVVQGPQGFTVDLTVNGADIRVGSTVVLRTLGRNDQTDEEFFELLRNAPDEISDFLQITVLDGEVVINPDSDDPTIVPAGETTIACLDAPQNLGIDGVANDQNVTDACGGWQPPQPIPPPQLESLTQLNQVELLYPIAVETSTPTETPSPTPTTTGLLPTNTFTPTQTPSMTLTPTDRPTLTPSPFPTVTLTPSITLTPSVTPLPTDTLTP